MTMAIEVRPPVIRPGSLPRSCSREDGTPKVSYFHRKAARRAARLVRPDRPGIQAYRCRYGEHYHLGKRHQELPLVCARCGAQDQTVAQTLTLSGEAWPPTCSGCAGKVARMASVAKVEAGS